MALRLVTAPVHEPLFLEVDVKPHLRVDYADDDDYLEGLVRAARVYVEETALSSALVSQTWELVLDGWPSPPLELPKPPLQSVTSITYTDIDGNSAVYDANSYLVDVDSWPGRLVLKDGQSWPSARLREIGGVVIRFVAGYGDVVEAVPSPIRQAMLLMIGDWYENRENAPLIPGTNAPVTMPFAARQLLANYRRRRF